MSNIYRVVVPEDSQDKSTWMLALGYAKALCEKQGAAVADVVLLIHTKRQLDGTVLAGFLGEGPTKALLKGERVSLPWGASLRLETKQTIRSSARDVIIIAYFAEERLMEVVDGLTRVAGVVAVPDLAGGVEQWANRWRAVVHGQAAQAPKPLIDDPVFVKALESITQVVNLSNGMMHPRDKEFADDILRILRAKGHRAEPPSIKSWAIANGWKPSAANELAALATKIGELKAKPSLTKIYNAEGKYLSWQT